MKNIILFIFSFSLIFNCFGQEEDPLLIKEIKQSTIINEPTTLHKGFFKLSGIYTFGVGDKIFTEDLKKETISDNGWAKSASYILALQYGITNRLEIGIDVPFETLSQFYSQTMHIPLFISSEQSNWELSGKGLGDINLGVHYQIIEGSKTKPSLLARLTAAFPTGEKNPTNIDSSENNWTYDLPTGYGETSIALDLVYRKIMYPFSYSAYGSMTYSFGGEKMMRSYEDPIKFRSGNLYYFGGIFSFMLNEWIAVENDLTFFYSAPDEFKSETDAFDYETWVFQYQPAIVFQLKRFRFAEKVIIPFFGKSAPADPQYIILAQYIF